MAEELHDAAQPCASEKPARPTVSVKRLQRCAEVLRLMGTGSRTLTDIAAAKKGEKGWSIRNLIYLMQSPEMESIRNQLRDGQEDLVNGLVMRQIEQIEKGGLKPAAQLAFRMQLIEIYKPRVVEQKVSGSLKQDMQVSTGFNEAELLRYANVIAERFGQNPPEGQAAPAEGSKQPMD